MSLGYIVRAKPAPGNGFGNQAEFEHSKSAGAQRGKDSCFKQEDLIRNFIDPLFKSFGILSSA